MLELDADQEALLRLPEPLAFLPKLASEIRRDMPRQVSNMSDRQLLEETDRSYVHASGTLRITHLPTLVMWTKTDVGSHGALRRDGNLDLFIRNAERPNVAAADTLHALVAQQRWPGGND